MEDREPYLALLNPIERLVIQLSRRESVPSRAEIHAETLGTPGAPDSFKKLAIQHSVRGLVLTHLKSLPSTDAASAPIVEELLSALPFLQKHATLWELEQERILSFLANQGLSPLVLKGGALRHSAYQAPVERRIGDLDILTSLDRVPEYLEALSELGYESEYPEAARVGFRDHHYHERVAHPNGFVVEVHWGLTRPSALFRLDHDWFFRRARPLQTSWGVPMLVPSPEDMLLHIVSQAEQEGFMKLSRIVDMDRVVALPEGLDWEYIRDRAGEGNLSAGLSLSVRLANVLLLTPAPRFLVEGQCLDPTSLRALELLRPIRHLMRTGGRGQVAAYDLFRLWCLPTWRLRRKAFSGLMAGTQDPLLWVWEEKDSPENDRPSRIRGLARVSKLLALQLWLGILGIGGSIFSPRRHGIGFWDRQPRGTGIQGNE